MFNNKVGLKKALIQIGVIVILMLIALVTVGQLEKRQITKNYNGKIGAIIEQIEHDYPDVDRGHLLILLKTTGDGSDVLKSYGYNDDISVIADNNSVHIKFTLIRVGLFLLTIWFVMLAFRGYGKRQDKEVEKIIDLLKEINKRNYQLDINDNSEEALSILKNELYKTTIMLQEEADNSKKEKLELKDSLQDISHQLKTPLTSISIILDNLLDDPDMPEELRQDFISDVKRETNNINFLVQTLLKLSKLDTDTVVFNRKETSSKALVDEAVTRVSSLLDLRNVELQVNVVNDFSLLCDAKWQVEAISNIIKNCIEHTPENGLVTVKIDDNKVYSHIVISDNGSGIAPEDLPHIFERFYKGKNATVDSVGIGLALAKSIIEKDKGTISASSLLHGAQFDIKYYKW